MAFRGKSKRKVVRAIGLSDGELPTSLEIKPRMVCDGHSTAHFERLCFKGCPVLKIPGRKNKTYKDQNELIDMDRRYLVYKVASVINEMDRADRSKINIFVQILRFFRFCDENNLEEIFCFGSIEMFLKGFVMKYHNGSSGKNLSQNQSVLKSFLKEYDSDLLYESKSLFFEFPRDSKNVYPYTDVELNEIVNGLRAIYREYSQCIKNDVLPECFPIGLEGGCSKNNLVREVHAKTNFDLWKYDLSRVAYFITCFYTGVNASSLLALKHNDISEKSFKKVSRGVFKLATVKGRQAGRYNYIDVGFTKEAKDFLISWIGISRSLLPGNSEYIFPKIIRGSCFKMTGSEVSQLNKVFVALGMPPLSSQKFRKTKASLIMRSTESLFKVAEGLNNSVETASKHYADGDSTTMEFSLAAALDIRQRTAKGESFGKAFQDSSYRFKDPVRDNYFSNSERKPTSISNGLRCTSPFGEKAAQLKKVLVLGGLASPEENVACYKFLDCFRCRYHSIIAEEQDIWLMLSFSDVILGALARPSVNAAPTDKLYEVNKSISIILEIVKNKFPDIYKKAYERHLDSPHPLWSEVDDLDLLLGVYK